MDSALLQGQVGVAGLSFAGFSAIHDLLDMATAGLGRWKQWSGFDADLDFFRVQVILQQDILETWQRDWFDFPVDRILSAGRTRLVRQHKETIEKTLQSIANEIKKLDPQTILQRAQEDSTTSRRMKWIAGQRDGAETSLKRIETLLNGLLTILPLQSRNPEMKFMMSILSNLSTLAPSSGSPDLSFNGRVPVQQAFDLRNLRTNLEKDLERRINEFQQSIPGHSMVIPHPQIDLTFEEGTAKTRSRGILNGNPIFVEWKSYEHWQGQKAILLRGRNDILARMLNTTSKPDEMLTFQCKGYFDDLDHKQYGFLFSTSAKPGEDLTSLSQLLQKPPPSLLPTLEQRYQIAYSLALTLSILHATGWLHKGIRSQNLLFLHHKTKNTNNIRWSRPYLSGFAYSRPDKPDELSEKLASLQELNVYRHPLAQGQPGEGYRAEYDIYSFGVVLYEIGSWTAALPLWSSASVGRDAVAFRREVMSDVSRAKIAHRLGREYCDVMIKCVDGSAFRDRGEGTAAVFYDEVVEVLGRLVSG